MTFSKIIALGLAGLVIATMSIGTAAPVLAGDTVLTPTRCMDSRQIVRFYRGLKKADTISIKLVASELYRVSVTKDGKTGTYEFDACTQQSRKLS